MEWLSYDYKTGIIYDVYKKDQQTKTETNTIETNYKVKVHFFFSPILLIYFFDVNL